MPYTDDGTWHPIVCGKCGGELYYPGAVCECGGRGEVSGRSAKDASFAQSALLERLAYMEARREPYSEYARE